MFNFDIAIQLLIDYMNNEKVPESLRDARKKLCNNLLVDTYSRLGELFQYKESFDEAIRSFKETLNIVSQNPTGNERQMIATTFNLGYCLENLKKYDEAKLTYLSSVEMLKQLIADMMSTFSGTDIDYKTLPE
jgi:tetratricopeptide (TPR) repeat protein